MLLIAQFLIVYLFDMNLYLIFVNESMSLIWLILTRRDMKVSVELLIADKHKAISIINA